MYIGLDKSLGDAAAANVLDQLPFGVLCRDESGRVIGYNSTLAEMFPTMATPAALGRTLAEISGEAESSYGVHHQQAMETGERVVKSSMDDHYAQGQPNLLRTVVPLRTDTDAIWGSATIVEDQTEIIELQAKLARSQKLESVGQLAAGIAHEINTPMQYIGDNTHFLKNTITRLLTIAEAAQTATQPNATPQDQQHLADLIAKSKLPLLAERAPQAADDALTGVENVSRIVTAMKRFSHPGTTDMAPVDLNDSIATTMTVCRNEWKYAADITTDFNELPPTEAHLGELNQVWLNLIVNAAHAITEHTTNTPGHTGHITITTTHQPDHNTNTITITDNGNGIPEDHLTRVLDPFFTTKDVGKGTGQGLTIAHNVITKDHNGTLTITSTQGAGTTITITLPTTQPTPTKDN